MLAARRGHDAVVGRLLELGADVGLRDCGGSMATRYACSGGHALVLTLLLDAGASVNARNNIGTTSLNAAAFSGATECVAMLLARGAELNSKNIIGSTALRQAASLGRTEIVQLLLQAGAGPTIRDNHGRTALDLARQQNHQQCLPLLEAAVAEPQRPRSLLKARALLDAAHAVEKARSSEAHNTRGAERRAAVAAAPVYVKGRAEQGQQLPRVVVVEGEDEELVACVKYALGLEYGGGVHFEGGEKPVGMLREVFVELCEMLVPKWDRPNV